MVLVFAIIHLYNAFKKKLSFLLYIFNLALTNQMDWSTIPASPSLISLINRGNIEGTLHKIMFVCFMFVSELVLQIELREGVIFARSFEMGICF